MNVERAIRGRRTHKVFASEPLPRPLLDELLELARWAPNHHLTNPWRFGVVAPDVVAGPGQDKARPERAPRIDVVSYVGYGTGGVAPTGARPADFAPAPGTYAPRIARDHGYRLAVLGAERFAGRSVLDVGA